MVIGGWARAALAAMAAAAEGLPAAKRETGGASRVGQGTRTDVSSHKERTEKPP